MADDDDSTGDGFEGWSLIPAHGEILLQVLEWSDSADVGLVLGWYPVVAWRVHPDCNGPEPVTVKHNESGFECCDREYGALLMPSGVICSLDGMYFKSLDEYEAYTLDELKREDSWEARKSALKEAEKKLEEAAREVAALRASELLRPPD